MSKSLKISVLAMTVAASVGVMQPASADVLATSVIELNNLLFSHSGGAVLNAGTDFSSLSYTNTGAEAVTFTGTSNFNTSGSNTPLDLPLHCNGSGCATSGLTPNGFQHLGTVTGNFAAADQNELGFPIAGLGSPLGATVSSAAYGQIQPPPPAIGNANSNNGLTAQIVFAPTFTGAVDISANFDYFWKVFLSAGEKAGAFAHSSGVVSFGLVDLSTGANVFTFVPAGLNWDFSLNGPAPVNLTLTDTNSGTFVFTTPTLTAGDLYQLTAREVTLAEVTSVPEPATLALFGISLLGLTVLRRRFV